MLNEIRIWVALRRYQAAMAAYRKNPNLATLARMGTLNNRWYALRYPDAIQPAW